MFILKQRKKLYAAKTFFESLDAVVHMKLKRVQIRSSVSAERTFELIRL